MDSPAPSRLTAAPESAPAPRVLVVDDEPLLLAVMDRILHGFEVETATDGRVALDLIAARRPFDVILADLSMPGMSGIAFYEALLGIHPGLAARVIFMSGGVFEADLEPFLGGLPNARIAKPFRGPALRAVVLQVLATTASPASS